MISRDKHGRFIKTGRNICLIEGCLYFSDTNGYCSTHIRRIKKHGDPYFVRKKLSEEERKARRAVVIRRYKDTEKGKLTSKRYTSSELGIETKRRVTNKRRALLKMATPKWVNIKDIKKFYKDTPKGFCVDHIHPLLGINNNGEHILCGLHVVWNLQYLTPKENAAKGNKVEWI